MSPKKFRFISSAALVVIGLIVVLIAFTRHGQIKASAAEKPAVAAQNPAPAAVAQPQELPPGTISVTAKAVTTAQFLARGHLTESQYMTVAEYVDAIAKANGGKTTFKKGDNILVPGIEPQPIVEKTRPFPKETEVRAIYMTGGTAGSAHGIDLVRRWHQAGGNAVVFDIKDSDGSINIPFDHPLAKKVTHHPITNLPKYVRFLHSLDMHVIARQALFRDDNIAQNHSQLAVQSSPGAKMASWYGQTALIKRSRTTTSPWPSMWPPQAWTKSSSTMSVFLLRGTRRTQSLPFKKTPRCIAMT
jgi:hypothetical protein